MGLGTCRPLKKYWPECVINRVWSIKVTSRFSAKSIYMYLLRIESRMRMYKQLNFESYLQLIHMTQHKQQIVVPGKGGYK